MSAIGHALSLAGSMTWEILWALILGFFLSAVVQAVVRRATVIRLMGDDRPRALVAAAGFGMASSSCSYAAVALARSLFRKGANFTAAMAFEIASTNLVIELGVIMFLLLGWQFTLAEFIGGPIIIVLVALMFRVVLRERLLRKAAEQAEKGVAGSMEGHAAMDMSIQTQGSFWHRLTSADGFTSVAHVFVMEWGAIWKDLVAGLLIAGAIGAWMPDAFWQGLFLDGHPVLSAIWGPLIGPIVAMLSFVCSIGNVAPGCGAVERRHQLRRGDLVHLRRPADPADPQHLPQVLRPEDDRSDHRRVLYGHGCRRVRRGTDLRPHRSDPRPRQRPDARGGHHLELHHLAQHRVPDPCRTADFAVLPHRWPPDARHDGRGTDQRHPERGYSRRRRSRREYPRSGCRW